MAFGLKVVIYLIAGYALFTGAIYLAQRRMMYFPAAHLPTPIEAGLGVAHTITLHTRDGLELIAWHIPPKAGGANLTVVYLHGNGGNIAGRVHRARPLVANGYGLLMVEYRGYGGNPGNPTEQGLYADARAGLDFLRSEGVSADQIVLLGESLGSGVAVQMAAELGRAGTPAAGLILEAPYTSTTDVAATAYWFLPVRWMMKDRFDSLAKISDIKTPLLVVQGERDRTIPVALGRRLLAAAPEPRRGIFIPDAGHNDLASHGADRYILDFLADISAKKDD
jgi:fermentation-respiration switch protein FrsA (DUF1100 family)